MLNVSVTLEKYSIWTSVSLEFNTDWITDSEEVLTNNYGNRKTHFPLGL